jgi:hypothetical protein
MSDDDDEISRKSAAFEHYGAQSERETDTVNQALEEYAGYIAERPARHRKHTRNPPIPRIIKEAFAAGAKVVKLRDGSTIYRDGAAPDSEVDTWTDVKHAH